MLARKEEKKEQQLFFAATAAAAAAAAAASRAGNRERILYESYTRLTRGSRTKGKKKQTPGRRRFMP